MASVRHIRPQPHVRSGRLRRRLPVSIVSTANCCRLFGADARDCVHQMPSPDPTLSPRARCQ
ncbi:hypothetical protein TRAPUB_7775 [Trametes pubescens]|uniref:Uncharacterized protein n=1 Tax=Trametes pubescens TaxID=154538 RepID=A0A1M2V2A8_TRAPU|nr:hypothetical protein TRAPUB_7775 [Trametes pubescens]